VLYDAVEETARAHGFVHYEVSNYARADRDEGDGDKPQIGFNTASENSPETRGSGATDEYTDARSRHNMRYWQQLPYIGLGPAAHSYLHPYRYATAASLRRYCEALDRGELPRCATECLDTRQCAVEMLMQGLRCDRGVDEQAFARLCGETLYAGRRRALIDTLCTQGYLFRAHGRLIPTRAGMRCADALALQLW
jgi:coproporphyrinogen III oxidase-like Fe-S oxidoreductase